MSAAWFQAVKVVIHEDGVITDVAVGPNLNRTGHADGASVVDKRTGPNFELPSWLNDHLDRHRGRLHPDALSNNQFSFVLNKRSPPQANARAHITRIPKIPACSQYSKKMGKSRAVNCFHHPPARLLSRHSSSSRRRMTLAGDPATTQFSSTGRVTTAPAATMEPLPMVTPGKMTLLAPIQTPSPITTGSAYISPARLCAPPIRCVLVISITCGPTATCSPIVIDALRSRKH